MDNTDNIDHTMSQNELILEEFNNMINDATQPAISLEGESQAPSLSATSSKGKKGNGLRFDEEYEVTKKAIYDVAAATESGQAHIYSKDEVCAHLVKIGLYLQGLTFWMYMGSKGQEEEED